MTRYMVNVTCLALVCFAIVIHPAHAEEVKSTPLLLPADVRAAGAGFQGVVGDASGAIHYPDEILAFPVMQAEDNKNLLEAWKASHRFFVVPLEISIAPAPDQIPARVDVSVSFAGIGSMARQPLVIDVFPPTGFSPDLALKGELKLGGDLKFQESIGSATAGGNIAMTVNYVHSFASVVSGFGSGTAFWQLIKTQDKQPFGRPTLKACTCRSDYEPWQRCHSYGGRPRAISRAMVD